MYVEFLILCILLFLIYINFSLIGAYVLNIFNLQLNINYSFFIGYAIFSILLTFLFNFINLDLSKILFFFSLLFLLLLFNFGLNSALVYKKIFNNFLIFFLPLILFFFFLAIFYEENFYVFRGNYWDLFAQISYGHIFSENSLADFKKLVLHERDNSETFDQMQIGGAFSKSYYFYFIEKFTHRQLQGLYLGLLFKFKYIDIFILTYAFKVFFISTVPLSFYLLIDLISEIDSFIKKYILSLGFALSTWSIYIFETDGLAQISAFSISILLVTLGFNFFKKKEYSKFNIYLLSLISGALFLIYPEQAMVMIGFIFILSLIFKRDIYFKKDTFFAMIFFIIITSPKLYGYLDASFHMSQAQNNFWGYFGSFILGSKNLVSSQESVNFINANIINNQLSNLSKIIEIINLHFDKGYNFILLTILPSLSGFYFLANGQNLSFSNLFFLLIFNLYLVFIFYKNLSTLLPSKKLSHIYFKSLIAYLILSILIFLIQFKIYIVLKIFFYLSPIFFILVVYNFKNEKIRFLLLIPLILFPIIKYSENNNGIGKLDSFPSILNKELKQNINWSFPIEDIKKCKNVNLVINGQIPNIYASLYLDSYKIKYTNNSKFVRNNNLSILKFDCKLFLNNGFFALR